MKTPWCGCGGGNEVEVEPGDLSGNVIVELGVATEGLNRRWHEANTGRVITDVHRHVKHASLGWMGATLDGRGKFMLPWSFSEEAAAGGGGPGGQCSR
jgi:hypothetical protein